MKGRVLSILLAAAMAMTLTACGNSGDKETAASQTLSGTASANWISISPREVC